MTVEGRDYNIRVWTKRKRQIIRISLQSNPSIKKHEYERVFDDWGSVVEVRKFYHNFGHKIENGGQQVFLKLAEDVEVKELPSFVKFPSEGIRRKLSFRGRCYFCPGCKSKHTYEEGCTTVNTEDTIKDKRQDTDKAQISLNIDISTENVTSEQENTSNATS